MQTASAIWKTQNKRRLMPQMFVEISVEKKDGTLHAFDTSKITYFHLENSLDLLGGALPINKIQWRIDNTDGWWSAENPLGLMQSMANGARVTVQFGMKVINYTGGNPVIDTHTVNGGVYYLTEWETPQNGVEARFTAGNALAYMKDTYTGIRVGTPENPLTLGTLAELVFGQKTLPKGRNIEYVLDSNLYSLVVDFSEETIGEYTRVDLLQLIANAGRCSLYCTRDGKVHIEPTPQTVNDDYIIDLDRSHSYPEYSFEALISNVRVIYGDKIEGEWGSGGDGNEQRVFNPLIETFIQSLIVARWVGSTLTGDGRRKVKGIFRADPRAEAGDIVFVESKAKQLDAVVLTSLRYTFNGGWKALYEGRFVKPPYSVGGHLGDTYSMPEGDIIHTATEV